VGFGISVVEPSGSALTDSEFNKWITELYDLVH
jgi:hypothetical protein